MSLEWQPRHRRPDPRVVWLVAEATNARGEVGRRAFWVLVLPEHHPHRREDPDSWFGP